MCSTELCIIVSKSSHVMTAPPSQVSPSVKGGFRQKKGTGGEGDQMDYYKYGV